MRTVALIPCRKGSKALPNKNTTKRLCGPTLWSYTLEAAKKSGVFDKIILSSDGGFVEEDIAEYRSDLVLFDNERPKIYATDEATTDALLFYYAEGMKDVELWCILQLTSPFRTAQDIKKAHKMIVKEKWDSLVSVTKNPVMAWVENATDQGHIALYHYHNRPMRQQRKGWYLENGAIYFTKRYVIGTFRSRIGGNIALYKMPKKRAWEIDDNFDWEVAEFLMNGRK